MELQDDPGPVVSSLRLCHCPHFAEFFTGVTRILSKSQRDRFMSQENQRTDELGKGGLFSVIHNNTLLRRGISAWPEKKSEPGRNYWMMRDSLPLEENESAWKADRVVRTSHSQTINQMPSDRKDEETRPTTPFIASDLVRRQLQFNNGIEDRYSV